MLHKANTTTAEVTNSCPLIRQQSLSFDEKKTFYFMRYLNLGTTFTIYLLLSSMQFFQKLKVRLKDWSTSARNKLFPSDQPFSSLFKASLQLIDRFTIYLSLVNICWLMIPLMRCGYFFFAKFACMGIINTSSEFRLGNNTCKTQVKTMNIRPYVKWGCSDFFLRILQQKGSLSQNNILMLYLTSVKLCCNTGAWRIHRICNSMHWNNISM